jgi:SAM-dependent methyltransferase
MRRPAMPDSWSRDDNGRRFSASAERNTDPIAAALAAVLPEKGVVLELASGSGQHVAAFARRWPALDWQPSDANPDNLPSIRAWGESLANLRDPVLIDACARGWGAAWGDCDVLLLANLLHLIAEPEADILLAESARALAPGGLFCLYGPFRRGGALVTAGDVAFDARLRTEDPAIGYKDIAWVERRLTDAGLKRLDLIDMPAGNLMLITRRPPDAG